MKVSKPVTAGSRHLVGIDRSMLYKGRPVKKLTTSYLSTGGRNNQGLITSRAMGGGHKRLYRRVTFDFSLLKGGFYEVKHLEYDPNRTVFIALIEGYNSQFYIPAITGIQSGTKIFVGENDDPRPGYIMPLSAIPIGSAVNNVETRPGSGAVLARAAGTSATLLSKDCEKVILKLKSGKTYVVNSRCMAIIGSLSNSNHKNIVLGKAGRNRWLGRRPTVRGVAMNPVDHPHGGGEGRTGTGGPPRTPWGKKTKGLKTVCKKRRRG